MNVIHVLKTGTKTKWIGNNLNAIIWKNNNKKNISYTGTLLTVIYVTKKKKETKNNYPLATISMQYVSVDAKS